MLDLSTGGKTISLLTLPVLNDRKQILGVVQLLNKKDKSSLSTTDINLATILMNFAGILIENNLLYGTHRESTEQLLSLMEASKSLSKNMQLL
jgi:GAF domain-containing protein